MMLHPRPLTAGFVLLGLLALSAPAAQAADDGATIMRRVLTRSSWKDMQGKAILSMVDRSGDARPDREIRLWSRKTEAGETHMIMLFDAPADYRGSGFLVIEHEGRDDDRWLYSKGMRRLTRIQASGRGGNFMSSDFTYYDIGRPKLADWTFERLADAKVDGVDCYVIAATPSSPQVAEDTGYHRVVWSVDKAREVTLAADYYDKRLKADPKAPPFKRMQVVKVIELGGVPFASHMKVTDAQTGRSSAMRFEGLKVDQGIPDSFFSKRTLLRGR